MADRLGSDALPALPHESVLRQVVEAGLARREQGAARGHQVHVENWIDEPPHVAPGPGIGESQIRKHKRVRTRMVLLFAVEPARQARHVFERRKHERVVRQDKDAEAEQRQYLGHSSRVRHEQSQKLGEPKTVDGIAAALLYVVLVSPLSWLNVACSDMQTYDRPFLGPFDALLELVDFGR